LQRRCIGTDLQTHLRRSLLHLDQNRRSGRQRHIGLDVKPGRSDGKPQHAFRRPAGNLAAQLSTGRQRFQRSACSLLARHLAG
jgi:hypothetical protein